MLEWESKQISLHDLANKFNINPFTLKTRIEKQGMTVDQALRTPVRKQNRISKKTKSEIIKLILQGYKNKDIANRFKIEVSNVSHIRRKYV